MMCAPKQLALLFLLWLDIVRLDGVCLSFRPPLQPSLVGMNTRRYEVGTSLRNLRRLGTNNVRRISSQRRQQQIRAATGSIGDGGIDGAYGGRRRVVVTGMGLTSPLGNTLRDVAASLRAGRSGLANCTEYADLGLRCRLCGRPPPFDEEEDIVDLVPDALRPNCPRHVLYALKSMVDAIRDAALTPDIYQENSRAACIMGQGGVFLPDVTESIRSSRTSSIAKNGYFRTMSSSISAVVSAAFRLRGPSYGVAAACATGAHSVGLGLRQIQLGKADVAFAGCGDDASCWEFAAMCDAMGVLSKRNDEGASRPFDVERDGFVLASGGGVMVLEELNHTRGRGADIYAEVVGYGATSDGYDMVAPSGLGGARCMRIALDEAAECGDRRVDYVNAHGTSTVVGDVRELAAIKDIFSSKCYQPWVGSTKSLTGHAVAAAGIHEAIYTILMMNEGFMAKSINIEKPVDEVEGMNILLERRDEPIRRAMSNSFGFGGTNCVLVFDKYDEKA